jgi:hypothetical protein
MMLTNILETTDPLPVEYVLENIWLLEDGRMTGTYSN